ncbi:MAG: hypothetical protein IJO19_01790, partial [Clostridia bacterium]|nr:hypothetical protein [Clostridia bacterium]
LPFEATPNFSEKVNLPNGFSVKNKKSDNKKIIKEIKKTKETKSTVNYLKNGKHTKKYYYFIPVILLILIIILIDMLKKRKSRDYFVLSVLTLNKKGYKTDGYAIARDNLSKKFFENFEKAKEIYYTKRFSNKEISADDELIIKDFFKTTKHIKRNKK